MFEYVFSLTIVWATIRLIAFMNAVVLIYLFQSSQLYRLSTKLIRRLRFRYSQAKKTKNCIELRKYVTTP